jgi:hypothetical protein
MKNKDINEVEQFISFKTAKLAFEKGFFLSYVNDGWSEHYDESGNFLDETSERYYKQITYTAFTYSSLQTLMRNTNLHVYVNHHQFAAEKEDGYYYHFGLSTTAYIEGRFETYESALEAGLIKKLKETV